MLRRLHHEQPDSFAFTPANQAWAEAQLTKYPEGRQASAVIPLLWRAQEQEGWLSKPAIETIADMLGMAYIRVLEVATFYFMFQLKPVGTLAHVQICGTTSCMICGAEDLIKVCQDKIADKAHALSADGKFSWEEVECLGACTNAPMVQIGKDFYEDLTPEKLTEILEALAKGDVPVPGPQNGRYGCEPLGGLTALTEVDSGHTQYNGSVQRAVDLGDTVKRIDGTEVPLTTPWNAAGTGDADAAVLEKPAAKPAAAKAEAPKPAPKAESPKAETPKAAPKPAAKAKTEDAAQEGTRPTGLDGARDGAGDDLKMIKGVGPALEKLLNELGFYHFDQVAAWTADEVAWVDQNLKGFKGRVSRDGWVDQARVLAEGGQTEFAQRVKKGDVY